jgi:hypothetical protein
MEHYNRRNIRLTHRGNAKFRHKKLTCKGTLRQMFICLRPRSAYHPPPLPLHTVFTQERWGELNLREGESGNSSQSWVENTNMTDCISSL